MVSCGKNGKEPLEQQDEGKCSRSPGLTDRIPGGTGEEKRG